jgi:hypothetical protein
MRIVAFDMGVKNFAYAVADIPPGGGWGHVVSVDVHDLRGGSPYQNLIAYLEKNDPLWGSADVVLVEQQLNRMNIQATKLACHVHAYFLHRHPHKPFYEYPSLYKTKYTHFTTPSSSHRQRKEHAVLHVLGHYEETDPVLAAWVASFPKKDDICDCILMCNTFLQSPLSQRFSASSPCTDTKTDF